MKHISSRPAGRLWPLFLVTLLLAWGVILPQPPVRADSPPNLTNDLAKWDSGFSGVGDVETWFNNARRGEESQLGLPGGSLGSLDLPSQAVWDTYSDDAKALYIINAERTARAGMKAGVIGLPFTAVQINVDNLAQWYANYLVSNNKWGHTADGRTPWQRIQQDPVLGPCHQGIAYAENLAAFFTDGTSNPLYIERAIYGWMYVDKGSNWGHREMLLLQDKSLLGPSYKGFTNNVGSAADEGFIGIGVVHSPSYDPFSYNYDIGTLVVMEMIDPISTGTCPWDVAPPAPTVSGITPNSGQNTGTVSITNLSGANFQPGATVQLTRSGYAPINATSVSLVSASQITCQFDLSGAATGAWTVVVRNPDGQSGLLTDGFTVTGVSQLPIVTSITPNSGQNTGTVQITNLAGSNFQPGATVKLTRSGQPDINATNVNVVSASKITCRFDLNGVAPGKWGVTVTNAVLGGTLPNAFTVTAPGPPPGDRRIYMPLVVRNWPEAETDVFEAIADTSIIQRYPNSHYGGEDSMWVGYDACWGGGIVRSLLAFDTGRLPQGAKILKATLRLRHRYYCDYGPSTGPIGAFRIRDSWNTGTVTWNTQPRFAEPPVGQTTINTRQFGWVSIDVTSLVQSWADSGVGHYGIMIRGPEGSGVGSAAVGFSTRQYAQGNETARIDVTYRRTAAASGPGLRAAPTLAPEPAAPAAGVTPIPLPSPAPGLFMGSDIP